MKHGTQRGIGRVVLLGGLALLLGWTPEALHAKRAPSREAIARLAPPEAAPAVRQEGPRRVDARTGLTRAWYGLRYQTRAPAPEAAAREFLASRAEAFGGAELVAGLEAVAVVESRTATHVHLRQVVQGLPVAGARFAVSLNRSGQVRMVTANPVPIPGGFTPRFTGTEEDAVRRAARHLGARVEGHPVQARPMIVPLAQQLRTAWVVRLPVSRPRGDWEVVLDGATGEVLRVRDHAMYDDGTGYAFRPDPLTTAEVEYGTGSYSDAGDADIAELNAERDTLLLPGLTQNSFNNWQLSGPYVNVTDWDSPANTVVTSPSLDGFFFGRSHAGFEDVMVYRYIDTMQRHLQSLGYTDLQNLSIDADSHGASGADNSYYQPGANRLAFGDGGVDDAEDADVILHEYGHAIHYAAAGGGNFGHDMRSIGEGNSDYWAGTFSARYSSYNDHWVFNWDGHNEFWAGRTLDSEATYDQWSGTNIYFNGSIWANGLWRIRQQVAADTADILVLEGLAYQSPTSSVVDAANGMITAASELWEGQYETLVYIAMAQKGFVEALGSVHGTVTDASSGNPVVGATVSLGPDLEGQTDGEGRFAFDWIPVGDYQLEIETEGYSTHSELVQLAEAGQLIELAVALEGVSAVLTPDQIAVQMEAGTALDTALTLLNLGGDVSWMLDFEPAGADTLVPLDYYAGNDLEAATGDDRLRGVTAHGGMFVVAGGNGGEDPNYLYFVDLNGVIQDTVPQPTTSARGFYDLASDGTTLYGSEGSWILAFDAAGTVLDSIPGPFNPNRNLAWDPDRELLWVADQATEIVAIDLEGQEQARWAGAGPFLKGLAYHPFAEDGATLLLTMVEDDSRRARVYGMNPATGALTDPVDLATGLEGGYMAASDVVGGIEGAEELWLLATLIEYAAEPGTRLELFALDWAVPWLDSTPRNGVLTEGGSEAVTLHLNAEGMAGGLYEAVARLHFTSAPGGFAVPVDLTVTTVDAAARELPQSFSLSPPWPNPFNPSTSLAVQLPERADIQVTIYDRTGREVAQMHHPALPAGSHRLRWSAPAHLASGLYLLVVEAGPGQRQARKLVLMK